MLTWIDGVLRNLEILGTKVDGFERKLIDRTYEMESNFRIEMEKLRNEHNERMNQLERKFEIEMEKLRNDYKLEIKRIEADLEIKLAQYKVDIIRWVIGVIIAQTTIIVWIFAILRGAL